MRKKIKIILKILIIITIILAGASVIMLNHISFGKTPSGERLKKIEKLQNFNNGKFANNIKTNMLAPGKFWDMTWQYIKGGQKDREPKNPLPVVDLNHYQFNDSPSTDITVIWLGHSSVIVEFEGRRYIFDPVFSQRAFAFQWIGPKRFHPSPITAENLPRLDGVIISHDHMDHLDYGTISQLSKRNLKFYAPFGIGETLEHWGVKKENILELNWWDTRKDGNIELTAAPARHFSGRGLFDRDKTLWCTWVLVGEKYKLFFSGDTGPMPEFETLGKKYGPFDLTMIKIGAYDKTWPDIHLNPEQAVDAHIKLNGKHLLPIHWGTFNLGLHSWYEPIERLTKEAGKRDVEFIAPKIGEVVSLNQAPMAQNWWEAIPGK